MFLLIRDRPLFMAWGGPEDMQGATEKSENIKRGHFDFNNLQGGGSSFWKNHKPNIASVRAK